MNDDHGQPIGEHPELAACLPGQECGCPCHSATSGMYGMYASHIVPCCYPKSTPAAARVETPAELACREIRELGKRWSQMSDGMFWDICGRSLLAILDRLGA